MNTGIFTRYINLPPNFSRKARISRYAITGMLLLIAVLGDAGTRQVFWETLASAYISVTAFVALTLLIFYSLEYIFRADMGALLEKHRKYQIPIAALLGALPGCGGAIMVVTQYSIGRAGFGTVVAVLTSTMGDAAFLLIAKEPTTALLVVSLSIIVGTISGYIVEAIHGYDFLRVEDSTKTNERIPPFRFDKLNWPWIALLVPGIVFGILAAFQVDVDELFGIPGLELSVGALGAVMSLALWFINPCTSASYINRTDEPMADHVWDKTTTDACFVTVWVIIAFLLFELPVHWTGWDLANLFATAGAIMPLMGVIIGLIPGCGPQVLTTTLYLQGVIPLSVQLGNAISNDGDALFPAIATAPKASVIATLYTMIPALIVAYGWFFLVER